MSLKTSLILVSISIFIHGCAVFETSDSSTTKQAFKVRDEARLKAYQTKLTPVGGKLWLESLSSAPLNYFTDKRKVSEDDKPGVEAAYVYTRETLDDFENVVHKRYTHYIPLLPGLRAGQQGLLISLYKGEITYGEYHTRLREFYLKQTAAFREKDQELILGLSAGGLGPATGDFYSHLRASQLVNSNNQPSTPLPITINVYQQAPRPPVNIMLPPMPGVIRR